MLRGVVVHIQNEQPILADLLTEPSPSDVVLLCRNVRTMGGKKPVFIDNSDSTFVIPLAQVRLIEMPQAAVAAHEAEREAERELEAVRKAEAEQAAAAAAREAEYAAGPLARLAWLTGQADAPADAPADPPPADPPAADSPPSGAMVVSAAPLNPDDIDHHLLQRVRDA
jgi:hypothetical protein